VTVSLKFALQVEDDWPPVGSESLPFEEIGGGYKCLSVPLFVKGLSVLDVVKIEKDEDGFVRSWRHVYKSGNSTVWLLRLAGTPSIETSLSKLRSLQCNTSGITEFGCYAIDVPAAVAIADVDAVLDGLNSELVAVAFPSMRHSD
jgi:hypothetical protein